MFAAKSPLAIPVYRFYWLARFTSVVAQNVMVVVIGWQTYDIARQTMSPKEAALRLGLVGLAQFLPLMVLTLVTGLAADRIDRRFIARATIALEMACAVILATMAWRGTTSLPAIFAVAALLGVARAFAGPALQALGANLVPREILPAAIAIGSLAWQVGSIGGPATGGYLYAIGPSVPYIASAVLFATSLCMLMLIDVPARAIQQESSNPWKQAMEGLAYLRRNRLVLGAISLDLFAVLLGGATALLPVYARDILHVGSSGLGHLRGAPALGSTVVALYLGRRPLRTFVGRKLLIAVGVFGGATILFGICYWFPAPMAVALVCLTLLGGADMISVFIRQSLIQLYTPDQMRGRVGAVSTLFISGSNELGEAESGFVASLIGPVAAVVMGGIGTILVALAWVRLFPELSRADRLEPPQSLE